MPILYSVIARGTTVLTKYASCAGNFSEVTEQIMTKIPPENAKLTYSHGSYLFHYICENRIIYMCITDDVSIMILQVLFCNFMLLHCRKLGDVILKRSCSSAFIPNVLFKNKSICCPLLPYPSFPIFTNSLFKMCLLLSFSHCLYFLL